MGTFPGPYHPAREMSNSPEEDYSTTGGHGHRSPEEWKEESTGDLEAADSLQKLYERPHSKKQGSPEVVQALCVAAIGLAILLGVVMFFQPAKPARRRVAVRRIHTDVVNNRDGGSGGGGGGGDASNPSNDRSAKLGREEAHEAEATPPIKMPGRPRGEGGKRKGSDQRPGADYDVVTSDPNAARAGRAEPPAKPDELPPAALPNDRDTQKVPLDYEKPPSNLRDVATLPPVSIGPAPLICVTGTHARIPLLPVDGGCDFAVFSDVIFGDNEWVAASSRSKLDAYLHEAEKSAATTFLLSFPAKMRHALVPFLSSTAATELIRSYAARGIRGYGFARAEIPIHSFQNLSADYRTVLKLLAQAMKAAVPSSGLSFMGVLLRGDKDAKEALALPFPTDIASNVDLLIAISHTPVQPPDACRVEPSSSWTHEHINDGSLPSLTTALDMLRDGRNTSATYALSLTMGILDYRVSTAGLAGIDGTWNIACSHSELEPFEQSCRNPLTRGLVGADDLVVYDFSKKTKTWRSFETADSIMAKVRRCFQLMRSSGFSRFGWALYDVDLEDHSAACVPKGHNEPSVNRLLLTKQLLRDMARNSGAAPPAA